MLFSMGPFITCFISIFFLTGYVYYILYRKNNVFSHNIKWIFVIISILLLRMLMPINFPFTISIPSAKVLPIAADILFEDIGFGKIRLFEVLLIIWIIGAIFNFFNFLYRNKVLYDYLRNYRSSKSHLANVIFQILQKANLTNVSIAIVPDNISPAIVGLTKPILIFPEFPLEEEEVKNIIYHEIEHYKNHDLWLKLLIEITACLHWWNPVVYLMKKELLLAMEISNDNEVVKSMSERERLNYAQSIVKVAKLKIDEKLFRESSAIYFSRRNNDLSIRISLLLKGSECQYKRKKGAFLVNCFLVLSVTILSFVFVPEAYSEPHEGSFEIKKEEAYLVKKEQGYDLYINSSFVVTLPKVPEELKGIEIYKDEESQK